MPNLMQTGAAWMHTLQKEHAGIPCNYLNGPDVISVNLVPLNSDQPVSARDMLSDPALSIRTDDFIVALSDLSLDGALFRPQYGHAIEWTDGLGDVMTSVVFPRVSERCYEYTDPGRTLIRVYTISQDSLESVAVRVGALDFSFLAAVSVERGSVEFSDAGQESRVLTCVVYASRSEFTAAGVTAPPVTAKVDCLGQTNWAVDMSQTEWGSARVKLGLQRQALINEWQARRNATL